MHSGADVEAFTAALNRDIGGADNSQSQPSDSDSGKIISFFGSYSLFYSNQLIFVKFLIWIHWIVHFIERLYCGKVK